MALRHEEHLSVQNISVSILEADEVVEDDHLILITSLWKRGSYKEECVK